MSEVGEYMEQDVVELLLMLCVCDCGIMTCSVLVCHCSLLSGLLVINNIIINTILLTVKSNNYYPSQPGYTELG